MTALSEIQAALKAAPKPRRGRDRVVLAGHSAMEAIYADQLALKTVDAPFIDGAMLRSTSEFPGWAIRDVDKAGVWHDVVPGDDAAGK